MGKKLRNGYTTGSCASAAAMAAAIFLFQKDMPDKALPEKVEVLLGNGTKADFFPEYGRAPAKEEEREGWCRVRKDAGDDPDVTDGIWIYAGVFPVSEEKWPVLCSHGRGYVLPEYPRLYLNGGAGIGIATKKGLSCPAGHYAINPVPRRMILEAVEQVRRKAGVKERQEIRIAIPEGIRLAEKTFNPRLGIQGGISVLGTTGIVEPMSEQALLETIRLDIRMKAVAGERVLLLTPGNYGETFLQEELGVPLGEAVKCSNFIGDALDFALEEGFGKVLLAGHIGKLVKVARGMRNTHSRYGDGRMEEMELLTGEQMEAEGKGGEPYRQLAKRIGQANTTEEAVGWLQKAGLAEAVLDRAAEKIRQQILRWVRGRLETEIFVFSSEYKIIGRTGQAEDFLEQRRAGE